jgi:hypothetical protein
MPLDGLSRRAAKLEAQAGGPDVPCEKCGQSGPPFNGRDRETALREAEQKALASPHVVEAEARAFLCRRCGRPRVIVIQHVDNWRSGGGIG